MGIRGTVRRSIDGDFIHSNIDIDLLIDEECEVGNDSKPEELFHIVERFCLGKRRLVVYCFVFKGFPRDNSNNPKYFLQSIMAEFNCIFKN